MTKIQSFIKESKILKTIIFLKNVKKNESLEKKLRLKTLLTVLGLERRSS